MLETMSDDPFVTHRSLLFTVAYEILGSAADAEDVLQESWLRWADVEQSEIRDARAFLVTVVTRKALNRLRDLSRRKEEYVGEWLPEPLLTAPDVSADVELAESVSFAMLTVLETLGPTERAVFVLREVFDVPFDEIAEAVGKTSAAVRQIAHRARNHVSARRPRTEVTPAEQQEATTRFLAAVQSGEMQPLLDLLAPDVVFVADGGGRVAAARTPLVGREEVSKFLGRLGYALAKWSATADAVHVNGAPGLRVELRGALDTAITFDVEDGLITRIYAVRNPDKLRWFDEAITLRR